MAVIYLFDNLKRLKRPVSTVQEIMHSEGKYEARAEISAREKPEYGDHFGFTDVDGRFRLFLIRLMDVSDDTGLRTLTGTDAAVAELNASMCEGISLTQKTAQQAAGEALSGTGWEIGRAETDGPVEAPDAYFEPVWDVLKTISNAAKVRITPYFEFDGNSISARKIDITSKEPTWNGVIITRKKHAKNIRITEEGIPYGRVYGLGKVTGTGDPPERVTIADAVWSIANGDPADKPAGQTWVSIPGAQTDAAYKFEDNRQTDANQLLRDAYEDLLDRQRPKASGTAVIGDVEMAPGYEHRKLRMWDRVAIRTEEGQTVQSTVINIDRYYVHREKTKITIGEETETEVLRIERQLAQLNRLSGLNSMRIRAQDNKNELTERLLFEASEEIKLRAYRTDVVKLEEDTLVRFNDVSITLDALEAEILLKASQTYVDNLGNEVRNLSSEVSIQAGQISSKVSANEIASVINQTPQAVLIDAGKIDLNGYVTADQLQATNASITNLMSGLTAATVLETNLLNAQQANVTYLSVNGLNVADVSMQLREVSMGSLFSHRMMVESATGALSLQHSHAVSVNTDGLLQLGEVSSSGGTFNIADTQFYKDGVEAAYEEGYAAGEAAGGGGESAGDAYNRGYEAGKTAYQPTTVNVENTSVDKKHITINVSNSYQELIGGYVLALDDFVDEIYTEAYNKGYTNGYTDGSDDMFGGAYEEGWNDAVNSVYVQGSISSIRNTAANTFFAQGSATAYIGGEAIASSGTFTKTQTINVGQ